MRAIHRWSVPSSARALTNPVAFSPQVWVESRAHFADHCASCHANDGSGDTEIGRSLFPKAPDMRLASTQDKSDGELYWIIENGIRLTGMPGYGDSLSDAEMWQVSLLLRHADKLPPSVLQILRGVN